MIFLSKKKHNISPKNFNSISHSSSELILENINENQQTQSETFKEDISLNLKKVENKQIKNKLNSKELYSRCKRQELVAKLLTKCAKNYKNEKLSSL